MVEKTTKAQVIVMFISFLSSLKSHHCYKHQILCHIRLFSWQIKLDIPCLLSARLGMSVTTQGGSGRQSVTGS